MDNNLINAFPVLPILDTLSFTHYVEYDLTIKTLRAENFAIDLYRRRNELNNIESSLVRHKLQLDNLVATINNKLTLPKNNKSILINTFSKFKYAPLLIPKLKTFYIGSVFNKILNKIQTFYKAKTFYIGSVFTKILNDIQTFYKVKTFYIGTVFTKILNNIQTFYKVKTFYIGTVFNKIFMGSNKKIK